MTHTFESEVSLHYWLLADPRFGSAVVQKPYLFKNFGGGPKEGRILSRHCVCPIKIGLRHKLDFINHSSEQTSKIIISSMAAQ